MSQLPELDQGSSSGTEEEKKFDNGDLKPVDLDDVLVNELGQFGYFQFRNLLLVSVLLIMTAFKNDFNFTMAGVPHRCRIPECGEDSKDNIFQTQWLANAVPKHGDGFASCKRYAAVGDVNGTLNTCPASLFNHSAIEACTDYVYASANSAVYDFDLGCKEWLRVTAGTFSSLGTLFCLPITAYISDRFGRKTSIIWSMSLLGALGLARAFSVNYTMFLVTQLLQTTLGGGAYLSIYILVTELVGPKYRVFVASVISTLFVFGQILMSVLAWYIQPWRIFLFVISAPCLIAIFYYWILSESVRWYLVQKRYEEAKKVLLAVAQANKSELTDKTLEALMNQPEIKSKEVSRMEVLSRIFNSRTLLIRMSITPIWFFTANVVYYGLNINSTSFSDTKYLNYILTSAVEIPAYVIAIFVLDRWGRKTTLLYSYLFCAACNIAVVFVSNVFSDLAVLRLLLYLAGKFGISLVFNTVFLFTSELYPTEYRHRLFALSATIGRIGNVVAPMTPALAQYWSVLPSLVFAVLGLISGILVFFVPETLGIKMPDTLSEAEAIGRSDET